MPEPMRNAMLTELGQRLVAGSLSDATLQRATEATPDLALLPWVNVVKIGGQSIMDRGRAAVWPLVDEIVTNLPRHKMILGTGAGTRARHIYSLAIDLGLPVGVLTVLGTAVAWQNAQMLQYLLARHGIAFLEPEAFASLPHYLMERGAVICQGMPPYKLWEENPEIGRIPPQPAWRRILPRWRSDLDHAQSIDLLGALPLQSRQLFVRFPPDRGAAEYRNRHRGRLHVQRRDPTKPGQRLCHGSAARRYY